MLVITSDKVALTRGDSADLTVVIKDLAGNTYELQTGDVLKFTLKSNCETSTIIIQKDCSSDSMIHLTPSDTNGLKYGIYKFDVQLTLANGKVYTVIPPHDFEITKEVTFNATV